MPQQREKLTRFEEAVFSDVDKQIQEQEKALEAQCESSLSQIRDECLLEAYNEIKTQTAQIRSECVKRTSKLQLNSKKEILLHRDQLVQSMFWELRKSIEDYTGREEYLAYLRRKFKEAAGMLEAYTSGGADTFVMKVAQRDLGLETQLRAEAPQIVRVEADDRIELGGFYLECAQQEYASYVVDMSLDSELVRQHELFNREGRLSIE